MKSSYRGSRRSVVLVLIVCCALPAAGCNSAGQRLRDAARTLAPRIGSTEDDIVRGFTSQMRGSSEEQIAIQAERTVQRTSWIDTMLARIAQNRVKIAKASHRAACEWIGVRDALAQDTEEAQIEALATIIAKHIQAQALEPDEAEIREIVDTTLEQIDKLDSGTFDASGLALDLACIG